MFAKWQRSLIGERVLIIMKEMTVKDNFINLSDVKEIPHAELFREVAKVIAEDTLQYINEHDKKVEPRESFYTKYGKRFIDIVISFFALIFTLPINLIIGIGTLMDISIPLFFKKDRVGKDGKIFTLVKFRNMTNKKDKNGDLLPPSQRVTQFGKFVRKTSLDELLNFWSIFKGDMSLIGPRPLLVDYLDSYSERHMMRHAVRPGLECPILQIKKKELTWADQFENEVYYVENVSLLLDIKMVYGLVRMVFDKKATAVRGGAFRGSFMGYNRNGSSISSLKVPVEYYEKAVKRLGY